MKTRKPVNPEQEQKKPIFETEINLDYTKGKYSFFCKTTTKIILTVLQLFSLVSFKLSDFKSLVSCIWIVNHLKNKCEGISSVSSSVKDNDFCKRKKKNKRCICSKCYADNQQGYQEGLKEHNIINGFILRNILIPEKAFKILSSKIIFKYLRIESFGDVANITQARNYLRIIKAFPREHCTIFSKNILIWEQAILEEGKPNNTTYVHSSYFLNKPDNINLKRFSFIDHIFTVYTEEFIKENHIVINCRKKCLQCIAKKENCFFKNPDELYINEKVK